MGREDDSYKEAAAEYGDLNRLPQTADNMGAHEAAQSYRDEADQVRQGLFGPDSQFKR